MLLFLRNVSDINAFAVGKRTVCLTKGALSFMDDEEIKGLIAHELGHLSKRHSMALQLITVGSFPFTLIVRFIHLLLDPLDRNENTFYYGLLKTLKKVLLFPLRLLEYLMMYNSRINEYGADEYAFTLGYGEGLLSALYKLSDMSGNDNESLLSILSNSHPHLYKRIERLESLGG
ncbi:MAG: M48 family metalloprotease [Clostridiales bacterium]|nr:M48 family metalloprotease [Clostridiales bacterium]